MIATTSVSALGPIPKAHAAMLSLSANITGQLENRGLALA